jgi:UDP-3-O-[3-hydroxymyristoyl] glucosamine N-acyltransferase
MSDPHFFHPPQPLSLAQIVALTGSELRVANDVDPTNIIIRDVAPLQNATENDISFLDNKKYVEIFTQSKAIACFVSPENANKAPKGMHLLISPTPYKAYALAAQKFYPEPTWSKTIIAPNAFIHPSTKIGVNCIIDHNVYVGKNVTIGAHCWIKPNTVLGHGVTIGDNTVISSNCSLSFCKIGSGVRLLPGVRIGQEGFGFAIDPSGHVAVPQLGRVIIGDRVWVGANTTIDRGAGPDTIIGDGCMIDNLVQIGHNVKIGKFAVIVAQVGISGSVEIEDYAVLAGQVGVAGHIRIGRGARIAAQSGLMKDVPAGAEMMGSPAVPLKDYFRQVTTLSNLTKKKIVNEQ